MTMITTQCTRLSCFLNENIMFSCFADYIAQHGRMPEVDARKKFWQIIYAVDYCHQRHVVHRDLKVGRQGARKHRVANPQTNI